LPILQLTNKAHYLLHASYTKENKCQQQKHSGYIILGNGRSASVANKGDMAIKKNGDKKAPNLKDRKL
jgi:hypothetical protein